MSEQFVLPHKHSYCESCPVRHTAVCGALSDLELNALSKINRQRKIASGQVILSDQDASGFFANVLSGTVKLIKTMPDGRQQIVGLLFSPDFLGRAFSFNNPYFAEAATDVELCCFPHDEFQRVIDEYPGLQHRLFENALDELDAAREWMLLLGRKTAEEKIASFLMLLAKRSLLVGCAHHLPPSIATFALPLTRADIADYLGLTIETVSRQLTRLKSRGIIKMVSNRVISVPEVSVLAEVAGIEDVDE
jgi:CRP/FNR family transcriptional regulator